jgi:hypothetical protein
MGSAGEIIRARLASLCEKTSTPPVRHCPQKSALYCRAGISARAAICSNVLNGQAPKPISGAPKARGLTAKARIERSWTLPRSDTV